MKSANARRTRDERLGGGVGPPPRYGAEAEPLARTSADSARRRRRPRRWAVPKRSRSANPARDAFPEPPRSAIAPVLALVPVQVPVLELALIQVLAQVPVPVLALVLYCAQ